MASTQLPTDAPLDGTVPLVARGRGALARRRRVSRVQLRWVRRVLRVPLAFKLLGANALIAMVGIAAVLLVAQGHPNGGRVMVIYSAALLVAVAVNVALVTTALVPIDNLTEVAERVRAGELDVRVSASPLADRDLARLGMTVNGLLDELGAERLRLRELASQVIEAGDHERARIARELHDGVAQWVAALVLHLGAVMNDPRNAPVKARLEPAKQIADQVLEELRTLAHVMHPRALTDLGLAAALEGLARDTSVPGMTVEASAPTCTDRLPIEIESVLYRVAQEAVANALRHGRAPHVRVALAVEPAQATLEVSDDGRGFDVAARARQHDGIGLFTMRERLSLVNGTFDITSRPGAGTRVRATVPLRRRPLLGAAS